MRLGYFYHMHLWFNILSMQITEVESDIYKMVQMMRLGYFYHMHLWFNILSMQITARILMWNWNTEA